jgi:hypothetical protein
MMQTLSKACTNCTSSKRKCTLQKPKCVRCSQKKLECVYNLDPLSTSPTEYERARTLGFDASTARTLGICLIRYIDTRSPYTDLAVFGPRHNNSLEVVRMGYQTVAGAIRTGRPASFVHPKLRVRAGHDHLAGFAANEEQGVRCGSFQQLIEVDMEAADLGEALTALQALMIHLAASCFSPCPLEQDTADKSLTFLSEWTQAMLARAEAGMPTTQSPWQDWLLGESKSSHSKPGHLTPCGTCMHISHTSISPSH